MDSPRNWLWSPRVRLVMVAGLLILLNLAFMALDSMVLPAQGVREFVPLSPPPQTETRPQRQIIPVDQLIGRFGFRPIDTQRPIPGLRPPVTDLRPRPPVRTSAPPSLRPFSLHQAGLSGMALHIVGLLALLTTSVILAFFLPERFRAMRDVLGGPWPHKLRTLLIGMLGYLAALLLAFLLSVVVSGLPYALLLVAVLAAVTAVGITAVSLALGRWLSSLVGAGAAPLAQLLLGVLLAFSTTILPYAGWAAAALLASFGMGAILLTRLGSGKPWSLRALQE